MFLSEYVSDFTVYSHLPVICEAKNSPFPFHNLNSPLNILILCSQNFFAVWTI